MQIEEKEALRQRAEGC